MANGKRTLRKFTLYSEELLHYKGIRCFTLLLHMIAFVLGISGSIIGVISFTNNPASPLPQTNCSLTTDIEDKADFPLNLLLLITGLVLVFVDIGITALLCMIKWRRCGVLSIAWYLVTVVCAATWTFISVFYLAVVTPTWVGSKETCDYLVMLVTLVAVSYCGILTLAYVVVIVVVISYDCNRWRNLRDL